ncbi:di-heme oxidoredictase family protein [Tianweitania sp.]|uniref:di-heme oxidoreductase family protein n=1 Tax=Tianweitania sp. TaxID=2021634 RepID=UPI003A102D2E
MRRSIFLVLAATMMAATSGLAGSAETIPAVRDDLTPKDLKRVQAVTRPATDFSKPEDFETMQGGAGTSKKLPNQDAFSQPAANITFEEQGTFKLGNGMFRKVWVTAPTSTQASDGLGPLFNARACQSCHLKDGRGHPPEGAADATSMFLRLARDASTEEERKSLADGVLLNLPDPIYGTQLQDLAVPGLDAEGKMRITYEEMPVMLEGGETVSLRKPTYAIDDLAYGPLHPDTTLSPRVTPQMIGLGLVEDIHPADLLAHADPDDANSDGISGKAQILRDPLSGETRVGRFGWKAQEVFIRRQSADAFAGDIGISSPDAPRPFGDCTESQTKCRALPNGIQERLGKDEAPDPIMDLVTFYSQNLAVPARRDVGDAQVLRGKQVFYETGCASCHMPKFVTRRDAPNKAHRFQLIWPYSDFLLHDMGEGLADGQKVGAATGMEWRTPPLWGIGLTKTVVGHTFFLHDGRARNLTEAILWHGGEAQTARDSYAGLLKEDRDALVRFLESL